jgi:hypothetical protein
MIPYSSDIPKSGEQEVKEARIAPLAEANARNRELVARAIPITSFGTL